MGYVNIIHVYLGLGALETVRFGFAGRLPCSFLESWEKKW